MSDRKHIPVNTLQDHVPWTRRSWLTYAVTTPVVTASVFKAPLGHVLRAHTFPLTRKNATSEARACSLQTLNRLDDWELLAQRGVDTAMHTGAQYADAHLTRTVVHSIGYGDVATLHDTETIGIGIRALKDGYWGFAACPSGDVNAVDRLARAAVQQAEVNGHGALPRTVELGKIPAAVGRWATPVKIDPFTISVEEKAEFMQYWKACEDRGNVVLQEEHSYIEFSRQERVVATSDGSRFSQTVFESGGKLVIGPQAVDAVPNTQENTAPFPLLTHTSILIQGIEKQGAGWELFLDANIPEQMAAARPQLLEQAALFQQMRPARVGRYTLVCDGVTMATLLSQTLGPALQIDRALGYEANATGTSFLDDPLQMLGTFQVASPLVTVTANRSVPKELATVKWDEEGVVPTETTLVKSGVVMDLQTTREQAAWLAPYYTKAGKPVRSNGCATIESALAIPTQQMPNLSLEPSASSVGLDEMVANVENGILVERGVVSQVDSQMRNGLLQDGQDFWGMSSRNRIIKNGRLGPVITDAGVSFNTLNLWKSVIALGGQRTQVTVPMSYLGSGTVGYLFQQKVTGLSKGEPPQLTSCSVRAVAATIKDQPVIIPWDKD